MTDRKVLNEITVIRAIACMCVVLLHSIKFIITFQYDDIELYNRVLLTSAGLLSFGTITFIFISAIILAYTMDNLSMDFYKKQIKYVLIPYIVMACFYGVVNNTENFSNIPLDILFNILGGYHGWFVLVIFQFYLLYNFLVQLSFKYSSKSILGYSFLLNIIYLSIFNVINVDTNNNFIKYFWETGYIFLFPGWLFYFTLAYYCGKNYESFISKIIKYKFLIYTLLPASLVLIVLNNHLFDYEYGSKRWDMIFFSVLMIFILFINLNKLKIVPNWLSLISGYSFGIYLFHYFAIVLLYKVIHFTGMDMGYLNIIVLFVGSILLSMTVMFVLNKIPFGEYVLGIIKKKK